MSNKKNNKPFILHIATVGSSDKLVKQIKEIVGKNEKIIIVDTKKIIDRSRITILNKIATLAHPHKYNQIWSYVMKDAITEIISKNKAEIIILVGILDQQSKNNAIYKLNASKKYFLETDISETIRNYYTRLSNKNGVFWQDVLCGNHIIKSSEDLLKIYQQQIHWYVSHNYTMVNITQLSRDIKKIINANKFSHK